MTYKIKKKYGMKEEVFYSDDWRERISYHITWDWKDGKYEESKLKKVMHLNDLVLDTVNSAVQMFDDLGLYEEESDFLNDNRDELTIMKRIIVIEMIFFSARRGNEFLFGGLLENFGVYWSHEFYKFSIVGDFDFTQSIDWKNKAIHEHDFKFKRKFEGIDYHVAARFHIAYFALYYDQFFKPKMKEKWESFFKGEIEIMEEVVKYGSKS